MEEGETGYYIDVNIAIYKFMLYHYQWKTKNKLSRLWACDREFHFLCQ